MHIPTLINRYYHLKDKLGSGSYGDVFHACNVLTNEDFAIKLSLANDTASVLHREYEILCKLQGVVGLPRIISCGNEGSYSAMILECLGPSLDELFDSCRRSFSSYTIAVIGRQLLQRLENIHLHNFVHWDIKPSNVLISTGQNTSVVYLIDFSIAKQYRDPYTHLHNAFGKCGGFLGSYAFASINSQLGFEPGRRDEIESLAYLLTYFSCGSLPWLGHPSFDSEALVNMKKDISQRDDIPQALKTMLSYSRSLPFTQKPDYAYLQTLVANICTNPPLLDSRLEWERTGGMTSTTTQIRAQLARNGWRSQRPNECVNQSETMCFREGLKAAVFHQKLESFGVGAELFYVVVDAHRGFKLIYEKAVGKDNRSYMFKMTVSRTPRKNLSQVVSSSANTFLIGVKKTSSMDGSPRKPRLVRQQPKPVVTKRSGNESEPYPDEYYVVQKAECQGLGLIKFTGELFKLRMLTERITHECLKRLLGNMVNPEDVPKSQEPKRRSSYAIHYSATFDLPHAAPRQPDHKRFRSIYKYSKDIEANPGGSWGSGSTPAHGTNGSYGTETLRTEALQTDIEQAAGGYSLMFFYV
ncbi:kinase-like domain-containing protein [Pisolithus albus]|nr:kinase-like domain-containing protein [Pisolithus albus]